ncbi:MAG: hypothetical protein U0798_21670 [Gemmataceae bacterium]
MSKKKIPDNKLLKKAAELRALGLSWAAIGREMRRSPAVVEQWQEWVPAKWKRLYDHAMRRMARDVTAESVTALRQDLRDAHDRKARRDSATKLLRYGLAVLQQHASKMDKKPRSDALPSSAGVTFARYVESLSPDHLADLIRDLGYIRREPPGNPATS